MKHKSNCDCVNCVAKGSSIREVYLKTVTAEELAEIEIFDWLEGFGLVDSLAVQNYIRHYGFLLIKLQNKAEELDNEDVIKLLQEARTEINDSLFVCDHSKDKIGELIVHAKKNIDKAIVAIRQLKVERIEAIKLIDKALGLIYDTTHPMPKVAISTLLSKVVGILVED